MIYALYANFADLSAQQFFYQAYCERGNFQRSLDKKIYHKN